MRDTITISLPRDLAQSLKVELKKSGLTRSGFVQKAIANQLRIEETRQLQEIMTRRARQMSIYTDEDVFKLVS